MCVIRRRLQQRCESGKETRPSQWACHMKVARSGLMNGLTLELMGVGEITRL